MTKSLSFIATRRNRIETVRFETGHTLTIYPHANFAADGFVSADIRQHGAVWDIGDFPARRHAFETAADIILWSTGR